MTEHAQLLCLALATLVIVYFTLLWTCWGTLSLATVTRRYKEQRELERHYDGVFQRRDDLLYHIGAAQQRGEHVEANLLTEQLNRVDEELDVLEEKIRDLDARSRRGGGKLKV
ncbi:unnamed protein product [Discosporangium mesarthrocarpum]